MKNDKEASSKNNDRGMRPIWYFVGYLLSSIGLLVVLAGLLGLYSTIPDTSVLSNLHPDLWWGGLITLIGLGYVWKNKNTFIK